MNLQVPQINLVFAWIWLLAGFVSGMGMGLLFREENWLGGYASAPRRMLRLGHISFFGLAGVNLMFYFTVQSAALSGALVDYASGALLLGGAAMPICCGLMAWSPRFHLLFGIPVISLLAGAVLTLTKLVL